MSTEGAQQNKFILNIIDSFGGVMDKYNKHTILSRVGTPLYRLYRYAPKGMVFLAVLDCINFDHFGLK